MTAVMRFALAVLHAEMRMSSSMRRSFGSLNGCGAGLGAPPPAPPAAAAAAPAPTRDATLLDWDTPLGEGVWGRLGMGVFERVTSVDGAPCSP